MADNDWGSDDGKVESERRSSLKEVYKGSNARDAREAPISKVHRDDRSNKEPPRRK
jgi:hypothetical protein